MDEIKKQAEQELQDLLAEGVKVNLRNLISQASKKEKHITKIKAEYAELQSEIEKIAAMSIEQASEYFDKQDCGLVGSAIQAINQQYQTLSCAVGGGSGRISY